MVTGFNTDVRHDGKTYHVQTEDKGLQNPIIETLIYVGGEILAARRTSYADLLSKGAGEKEIAERIESQHNRMILDIREGRYDSKKVRPFGEGIISSKSFDEVVLDYLKSQAAAECISLQMVGSDGFVEGGTGDTGKVSLTCALPLLEEGTAALIIQASMGKESAQIKQLIKKPV